MTRRFIPWLLALCVCGCAQETSPDNTVPVAAPEQRWVVTHNRFGPLAVGMSVDEAREAVRGSFAPTDPAASCDYAKTTSIPNGTYVMLGDKRVVRFDIRSDSIATAEGARVGDSEARIKSLYPNRIAIEPHHYVEGHYLIVRPVQASDSAFRILFETDGKKVTSYRAGRVPEIEWVEGCS